MTQLSRAAVAEALATLVAEALDLPQGDVPGPPGEGLVPVLNDWLATRNWRLASVKDARTFAWPGSWIALAADSRSPLGWRPVLMFGVPSGVLHDPLGDGRSLQIADGLLPVPLDRRGWRTAVPDEPPRTQVGTVVALMTAPRAEADALVQASITARPGGIDGDRYQSGTGTFSTSPRRVGQDITLIEAEALDELAARGVRLAPEHARRNVVTRGIDLDALIGRRFRAGEATCLGQRRCEPCAHLERLTSPGALRGLVHRGGLRADVLEGGAIAVGDTIRADDHTS